MLEGVGAESRGSRLAGCLVGLGAGAALVAGCVGLGWSLWNRVPDRAPEDTYGLSLPDSVVAGVDHARVHRELWPAWVIAREPGAREAATAALVGALAADPGLASIAADLGASDDALGVSEQVDLWNAALTARSAPWALGAGLDVPIPYVKSYLLVARPTVSIGDRSTRVAVGLRADRLAVVEGWLGLADDVGEATVVVDRVADFAFDELWPALDPSDPDPLAVALRAGAREALGDEVVDRLERTAPARRAMVAAREAVEDRRDRCGSDFVVRFGWSGLDDLRSLYRWAETDANAQCPGLTYDEADALARGSLAIRRDPELPEALERLVGWAARHVVVHEARHQLDHEDWGAGEPPPCEACTVHGRARVEASAYLSALGSGDALVAWFQGCQVVRGGAGGSAEVALEALAEALGASCEASPPADLHERAAALSRAWFGRVEGATIEGLPDRIAFALTR